MINVKDDKEITSVISDAGFEPDAWALMVWYFHDVAARDRPYSWAIVSKDRVKDFIASTKGEVKSMIGFDITGPLEDLVGAAALNGASIVDAARDMLGRLEDEPPVTIQ